MSKIMKERGAVGTTEEFVYPIGANGGTPNLVKKEWQGLTREEFIHYAGFVYPEILDEIETLLKDRNK